MQRFLGLLSLGFLLSFQLLAEDTLLDRCTHQLAALNSQYSIAHQTFEDWQWQKRMGWSTYSESAHKDATARFEGFKADPDNFNLVNALVSEMQGRSDLPEYVQVGLKGWQQYFAAYQYKDPAALALMQAALELEKGPSKITADPNYRKTANTISLDPSEDARKAAYEWMLSAEKTSYDEGFLKLVKARNAFARAAGAKDFYSYRLKSLENMDVDVLFAQLDSFLVGTDALLQKSLATLREKFGADVMEPWNFGYKTGGGIYAELDEYLPVDRTPYLWALTMQNLGVTYNGGALKLDLLDRKGKHPNGWCHNPIPGYVDYRDPNHPVNMPTTSGFTSNGDPKKPGTGFSLMNTFAHEGGHAAHFANVKMPAPSFGQEYPPTSMAVAELQSMFMDSLIEDPQWLIRYARNAKGEAIPKEKLKALLENQKTKSILGLRGITVMPYFERWIYGLSDAELDNLSFVDLQIKMREIEFRVIGRASGRPLLTTPHHYDLESAGAYQGYWLAEISVAQTREYFMQQKGGIVDNPEVGRLMAEHYWNPGNSKTLDQILIAMTGKPFSSEAALRAINRPWAEVEAEIDALYAANPKPLSPKEGIDIGAQVIILHGEKVVATNEDGFNRLQGDFTAFIDELKASED